MSVAIKGPQAQARAWPWHDLSQVGKHWNARRKQQEMDKIIQKSPPNSNVSHCQSLIKNHLLIWGKTFGPSVPGQQKLFCVILQLLCPTRLYGCYNGKDATAWKCSNIPDLELMKLSDLGSHKTFLLLKNTICFTKNGCTEIFTAILLQGEELTN